MEKITSERLNDQLWNDNPRSPSARSVVHLISLLHQHLVLSPSIIPSAQMNSLANHVQSEEKNRSSSIETMNKRIRCKRRSLTVQTMISSTSEGEQRCTPSLENLLSLLITESSV